ncbi:MAG: recombinase family protein [Oscillospiraceae bacterium]|nr:recombinase family protein [Oscillospiraceae bacterium]
MILVASYCRVSTDKDDQANSFDAQQRYFRDYIDRMPDWELFKVYADEGISGTSTKKRVQFNRMISDAKMGKFKLIITKEVSRFSRNILDTIQFTRELRALGVGVLFMNDGINTLEPDAELRLFHSRWNHRLSGSEGRSPSQPAAPEKWRRILDSITNLQGENKTKRCYLNFLYLHLYSWLPACKRAVQPGKKCVIIHSNLQNKGEIKLETMAQCAAHGFGTRLSGRVFFPGTKRRV